MVRELPSFAGNAAVSKNRIIIPEDKNSALRQMSSEVPLMQITGAHIQTLIADMKALLAKEEFGVALAACQVGESVRIFVVSGKALALREGKEEDEKDNKNPVVLPDQVYINPELLKMSRAMKPMHEGCLSIRGKWGMVPRAEKATIRAYDEKGVRFSRGASGFLAHIFQHEMDHLNGTLYTDKATEMYDDEPAKKKASSQS